MNLGDNARYAAAPEVVTRRGLIALALDIHDLRDSGYEVDRVGATIGALAELTFQTVAYVTD